MSADLILRNGRFTTLDRSNPTASAVAIANGVFTAVGRDEDVMPLAGAFDTGHRPEGSSAHCPA